MKCRYCGREVEEGFSFCPTCGSTLDETAWIELKNEDQKQMWDSLFALLKEKATDTYSLATELPGFLKKWEKAYADSKRMSEDFSAVIHSCSEISNYLSYLHSPGIPDPREIILASHNNKKYSSDLYKLLYGVCSDFSYPEANHARAIEVCQLMIFMYNFSNSYVISYEDIQKQYEKKNTELSMSSVEPSEFLTYKNNTSFTYEIVLYSKKVIPGGWFSKPSTIPSVDRFKVLPGQSFKISATCPKQGEPFSMYWQIEKVDADNRFTNIMIVQ